MLYFKIGANIKNWWLDKVIDILWALICFVKLLIDLTFFQHFRCIWSKFYCKYNKLKVKLKILLDCCEYVMINLVTASIYIFTQNYGLKSQIAFITEAFNY